MKNGERVEKKSTKAHYKVLEMNSNGKIILQRLVIGSKSDNTLIVDDLNAFKGIKPIPNAIMFFDDEYDFLSTLFETKVNYNGNVFSSAEHAFQFSRASDDNSRKKILNAESPSKAKVLGKLIKPNDNWEKIEEEEMYKICLSKFTSDEVLKEKLLATKDLTLINGNTSGDSYWGASYIKDEIVGENKLGKILMRVREEIAK